MSTVKKVICCKCQDYNWDLADGIDYGPFLEIDGKRYCVFHAPNGQKGIGADAFKANVIKKIFMVLLKFHKYIDVTIFCLFASCK